MTIATAYGQTIHTDDSRDRCAVTNIHRPGVVSFGWLEKSGEVRLVRARPAREYKTEAGAHRAVKRWVEAGK